jgi:hypothetical protein
VSDRYSRILGFFPRKIHLGRVGIVALGLLLVLIAVSFMYATASAWKLQKSAELSCGILPSDSPRSYIQYNVKDQATESYFRGSVFISLAEATGAAQAEVRTTAGHMYGDTVTHVDFFHDDQNKTFWMRKESDEIPFVRVSGKV